VEEKIVVKEIKKIKKKEKRRFLFSKDSQLISWGQFLDLLL
jgi:hypothetical protein